MTETISPADQRDSTNDETPGRIISGREFRETETGSSWDYAECARGDLNPHARKDTAT